MKFMLIQYQFRECQNYFKNSSWFQTSEDPMPTSNKKRTYLLDDNERRRYEMLCRRDLGLSPNETSKLRCRYVHKDNPYLFLAPLKEEEAFLDPRIVIYREIIYPNEIEIIKRLAAPRVSSGIIIY